MERFIKETMLEHLWVNSLLSREQHGFLPGKSTVSNLLEAHEDWCDLVDNGDQVDVVFTDFSKAFDSVNHGRLIKKLSIHGVSGCLLQWLSRFLTERRQRVKVGTEYSESSEPSCGVPQGSVMGPLFFLLYVNDLPDQVKSKTLMLADDVKMWAVSNGAVDNPLQESLDHLHKWASVNGMPLNPAKCAVMSVGREKIRVNYTLGGEILRRVEHFTDLGLIVQQNLKFDAHVETAVAAGRRALFMLR